MNKSTAIRAFVSAVIFLVLPIVLFALTAKGVDFVESHPYFPFLLAPALALGFAWGTTGVIDFKSSNFRGWAITALIVALVEAALFLS
jgi:hypothetical protein